jgi:hypothetical protein
MQKIVLVVALFAHLVACAQKSSVAITLNEVTRVESILAADSMQGRKAGTPGSDRAAAFIAAEFKKAGLQPLAGSSYLQSFRMLQPRPVRISAQADSITLKPGQVAAFSFATDLHVTDTSGWRVEQIKAGASFFRSAGALLRAAGNKIVFVDSSFAEPFRQLTSFQQPVFESQQASAEVANTVFILGHQPPRTFSFHLAQVIDTIKFANVVGVLPGKGKKDEQVLFSAHYDHLGTGASVNGDSIYNGANDDASGTTAVILLARHFKKANNNARTLVFAAFTAEEMGGFGSQFFSQQLDPEKIAAMFNIEMIGTESKWGRNSAFITGFEKTNMGTLLQKNLASSKFRFHADPYPDQQLFYRSDNATLARLGVPAHTISTSKMDSEQNYHQLSDEVKTLDLQNMTEIIKAIASSAGTIVAGKDTPTRVKKESLK